jgi:hypothetical protein
LKSSLQVHTVDGETVRTRRLVDRRLELITSDRKKDIQLDVHKTIGEATFTSEIEHDDRGNVTCRLPDNAQMAFQKFIEKIVELFVGCVKRYEKNAATTPGAQAAGRTPQSRQRSRRYHKRHHNTPSPTLAT